MAGASKQRLPFLAVGANAGSMQPPRRQVSQLVAEHLLQQRPQRRIAQYRIQKYALSLVVRPPQTGALPSRVGDLRLVGERGHAPRRAPTLRLGSQVGVEFQQRHRRRLARRCLYIDGVKFDRLEYLQNPRLSKGTAFTEAEREALGLTGLYPDVIEDQATQLARVRGHLQSKASDLERYVYLSELQDRNEQLFYAALMSDLPGLMPIVYTPTVGEACQQFGHIFRRPKGLYLSLRWRGRLRQVLRNWPISAVRFIVVTDGERILGLGDLGAGGMGIPVGKLALYSAVGGVPPEACLPIMLDTGTDNAALRADPFYPGQRHARVRGQDYALFIAEFVEAAQSVFPGCCIQFEDFAKQNAVPLLERYRDTCCCFNDDVQGTAAVAVAGLLGATRVAASRLADQRVVFLGAGSAAVGIADLIERQMVEDGLPQAEARRRLWLVNSRGLVTARTSGLESFQKRYAHEAPDCAALEEIIATIRPSALIGVSAVAGAFTEPVIRRMAEINQRPIIFPYSNPTARSECTPQQALDWSDGRAIVACGSPFPPVTSGGRSWTVSQGNNVYIYPAVGMAIYATRARRVSDELFLCAAQTLAAQVSESELAAGLVYPPIARIREAAMAVSVAVATRIFELGLAQVARLSDIEQMVRSLSYSPDYKSELE